MKIFTKKNKITQEEIEFNRERSLQHKNICNENYNKFINKVKEKLNLKELSISRDYNYNFIDDTNLLTYIRIDDIKLKFEYKKFLRLECLSDDIFFEEVFYDTIKQIVDNYLEYKNREKEINNKIKLFNE